MFGFHWGEWMRIRRITTAIAGVVVSALLLAGCVTRTLETTFDPQAASFIHTSGNGRIEGQAFLRRNDGVVVYAAGSHVTLIPATAYADERIAQVYGSGKRAYLGVDFQNDDPRFHDHTRSTKADGEGRFVFDALARGRYYVVTSVYWLNGQEGGWFYETATVDDGPVTVIMSGS